MQTFELWSKGLRQPANQPPTDPSPPTDPGTPADPEPLLRTQ
jgi:hypothetical protein